MSGLTAVLAGYVSFYTDSNRNKFSSIALNCFYSLDQQYWFILNSNIFLDKLNLHLFGDTRYYKFPTNTFGLGTQTSLADALVLIIPI